MNKHCLDIQAVDSGLNFMFQNKMHATQFAAFVQEQISSRVKNSKQLVSHDEKNATANVKTTILTELAPVCRDDLVLLPKQLAKDLGGIGPLVLVYKISKFI